MKVRPEVAYERQARQRVRELATQCAPSQLIQEHPATTLALAAAAGFAVGCSGAASQKLWTLASGWLASITRDGS